MTARAGAFRRIFYLFILKC